MERTTGRQAADEGASLALAGANHEHAGWAEQAKAAFKAYAETHQFFTTEDVRNALEDVKVPKPSEGRAWGGIMRSASLAGWVEHFDWAIARDPKVHNNTVRVWRSTLYVGA